MKIDHPEAGEWVKPKRRFYFLICCDCNLVHKLEFALKKDKKKRASIYFRAWRSDMKELKKFYKNHIKK